MSKIYKFRLYDNQGKELEACYSPVYIQPSYEEEVEDAQHLSDEFIQPFLIECFPHLTASIPEEVEQTEDGEEPPVSFDIWEQNMLGNMHWLS